MSLQEELERLRRENQALKQYIRKKGLTWSEEVSRSQIQIQVETKLQPEHKIKIFKSLFRGRSDVFAERWESGRGKAGYSPVCSNLWKPGLCGKPAARCSDCRNRSNVPIADEHLHAHLTGRKTIGLYPLLQEQTCWFLNQTGAI